MFQVTLTFSSYLPKKKLLEERHETEFSHLNEAWMANIIKTQHYTGIVASSLF